MKLPSRHYYHYTALHHAEEIVASGGISRGGIPIPDPSGEYLDGIERGWQWLTTSADWAQPWATRTLTACDRTEVRFTVEIPLLDLDRLARWDNIAVAFGYSKRSAERLAQFGGGDSSSWFVVWGTIPKSWFRTVEKRPGLGADVSVCEAWR